MASLSERSTSHNGMKLKSYTIQFKTDAVQYAEENSNHKAAEKFSVSRKRILEWRKYKDVLASLKKSRKRADGGGRKPLDEGMEESLAEWIYDRRATGLRVSGKLVCAKAKKIFMTLSLNGTLVTLSHLA